MAFDFLAAPEVQQRVLTVGTLVADLVGVFSGAVLGALQAGRRKMDLMGFIVLGLVSGVGGGIIRDTLLQAGPPLALVKPSYMLAALLGAFVAFLFDLERGAGVRVFSTLDALTLGAFAVAGTQRTLDVGLPAGSALLLGVITSVGGGIVRDVLTRQTPTLMKAVPGYYAIAALAASIVCLVFSRLGHPRLGLLSGAIVGAVLRLVSLRFGWRLPVKRTRGSSPHEGESHGGHHPGH